MTTKAMGRSGCPTKVKVTGQLVDNGAMPGVVAFGERVYSMV